MYEEWSFCKKWIFFRKNYDEIDLFTDVVVAGSVVKTSEALAAVFLAIQLDSFAVSIPPRKKKIFPTKLIECSKYKNLENFLGLGIVSEENLSRPI